MLFPQVLLPISKKNAFNLLDPFGFNPQGIIAKYMTVDEKNLHAVPLTGAFLLNRILWLTLSLLVLAGGYFRFSFNTRKEKVRKAKAETTDTLPIKLTNRTFDPRESGKFSLNTLWFLISFETKSIVKNPTFIIITIFGLLNLSASISSFTGRYGVDQYPVTYDVIGSIRGSYYLFIIGIITFYTGVLIWKERDARMDEIQDATPMKTGLMFTSKLIAMLVATAFVLILAILGGMIAQTLFGYHRYQVDVYIKSLLVLDMLSCLPDRNCTVFHYITTAT
ncbi:MAG: hypothetical protein IPH20_06815 [Bacteroidales bacterium]|nr:hypothetical protein [Bacteroidales bacterium]